MTTTTSPPWIFPLALTESWTFFGKSTSDLDLILRSHHFLSALQTEVGNAKTRLGTRMWTQIPAVLLRYIQSFLSFVKDPLALPQVCSSWNGNLSALSIYRSPPPIWRVVGVVCVQKLPLPQLPQQEIFTLSGRIHDYLVIQGPGHRGLYDPQNGSLVHSTSLWACAYVTTCYDTMVVYRSREWIQTHVFFQSGQNVKSSILSTQELPGLYSSYDPFIQLHLLTPTMLIAATWSSVPLQWIGGHLVEFYLYAWVESKRSWQNNKRLDSLTMTNVTKPFQDQVQFSSCANSDHVLISTKAYSTIVYDWKTHTIIQRVQQWEHPLIALCGGWDGTFLCDDRRTWMMLVEVEKDVYRCRKLAGSSSLNPSYRGVWIGNRLYQLVDPNPTHYYLESFELLYK